MNSTIQKTIAEINAINLPMKAVTKTPKYVRMESLKKMAKRLTTHIVNAKYRQQVMELVGMRNQIATMVIHKTVMEMDDASSSREKQKNLVCAK